MQEAFDKLKGVDIFSLKSYMEPTGYASFNELGFSLMNFLSISSFSSSMLLLAFSLCSSESLKVSIFTAHIKLMFLTAQKSLWNGFTGSTKGNVTDQSLVALLLLVLGFYLFYQYFFSKGSFAKTLLHICLVILLGFSYFGTIAGTSGGLYLS